MATIDNLISKYFEPKQPVGLESLLEMIQGARFHDDSINEEGQIVEQEMSTELSGIPEIGVSELGWAGLRTGDAGPIPSEQRAQLANFLNNVAKGGDLQDKIAKLAEFYSMNEETMKELQSTNQAETIRKTMGYLTFYKTLTKIITNFNASAAGFAFESFLGVLLGGNQISTGNKTIADLTTADGTPISLKLYNEKTVHVGGSYTDLVNDLVREPNLMQYVVVMKSLEGEGLDLEGTLKFYRFNFTLDNVYEILGASRHPEVLQLPSGFVNNPEEFNIELPEYMSAEESEKMFVDTIKSSVQDAAMAERLLQAVNWAKNPAIFSSPRKPGFSKISVGQGGRSWRPSWSAPLLRLLKNFAEEGNIESNQVLDYFELIYNANEEVRKNHIAVNSARRAIVNKVLGDNFISSSRSAEFYDTLSPQLKKIALRVSRGFINTHQFSMNRRDVLYVPDSALPEGQSDVKIGEIEIGASRIQRMIDGVRNVINTAIFDIFNNLKLLTTNIQGYFAGGMEDDKLADTAIQASTQISEKTTQIKSEK